MTAAYHALVSSDWNECLAPCGPFDLIIHQYPHLHAPLQSLFREYTSNRITLPQAVAQINSLLPGPMTAEQTDAYLAGSFETYTGVDRLIRACREAGILFMINTTGMIGYFQRALAADLIPEFPLLSAHPLVRFASKRGDRPQIMPLHDTADKAKNTALAARQYQIAARQIILIGDSGGDGPHFQWGASIGARLIGSMTKSSLAQYCLHNDITIDHYFGIRYGPGQLRRPEEESRYDFGGLFDVITRLLS